MKKTREKWLKSPKRKKMKKERPKRSFGIFSYFRTIRGKVVLSFGLLTIVLLVLASTSYLNMMKLQKEIDTLITYDMKVDTNLKDLSKVLNDIEIGEQGFVITGATGFLAPYQNGKKEVEGQIKDLHSLLKDDPEQLEKMGKIEAQYGFWMQFVDRVIETRKDKGLEKAANLVETGVGKKYLDGIRSYVDMIVVDQQKDLDARIDSLTRQVQLSQVVTIGLSAFAVLLAVFFGIILSHTIKTNTKKISTSILEIANAGGDLTKRIHVKSKDELADLASDTNQLIAGIALLVKQVSEMAENVSASSQELLASAEETSRTITSIAETSSEIAAGSDQTTHRMSSSLEKMNSLEEAARFLFNQAELVRQTARDMRVVAEKGGKTVHASSTKMMSIEETMSNTSETVEALGQRSTQITTIIGTITDIAEQTNLLALNAAIEAARAGEHGRGFAVVADEVRKLAEQSRQAAKGVTEIVHSIQEEVNIIIKQNSDGVKEVIAGVEITNETNASLEDILSQTTKTTVVVDEMVDHIQETLNLSQEVATSFAHVNEIAESTASNTETTAAASEEGSAAMEQVTASASELSQQAEKLKELISSFKI
ncbi:methyl-accepting chemotaxis protein [Rossellomorea vietnamensis]|uniref:methyl-accepting chemotaxis protein n=1 Tax=Rossellomorea TaxID=2837508 RepID=UPI001CCD79E9|nr:MULTISPECIES: methyl-accepting chemotaxis protein [Rossellomorea]MCA0147918.1 methyl-accepting chemotaxis protein [Rossellomorea vietnamensis]UTE76052.1 methyl-accepting chemotaxis protein [Rossellomorea sp. KS-H15a]